LLKEYRVVNMVDEINVDNFNARVCEEVGGKWEPESGSCTLEDFSSLTIHRDGAMLKLYDKKLKIRDIFEVIGEDLDIDYYYGDYAESITISARDRRKVVIKSCVKRLYGVESVEGLCIEIM